MVMVTESLPHSPEGLADPLRRTHFVVCPRPLRLLAFVTCFFSTKRDEDECTCDEALGGPPV